MPLRFAPAPESPLVLPRRARVTPDLDPDPNPNPNPKKRVGESSVRVSALVPGIPGLRIGLVSTRARVGSGSEDVHARLLPAPPPGWPPTEPEGGGRWSHSRPREIELAETLDAHPTFATSQSVFGRERARTDPEVASATAVGVQDPRRRALHLRDHRRGVRGALGLCLCCALAVPLGSLFATIFSGPRLTVDFVQDSSVVRPSLMGSAVQFRGFPFPPPGPPRPPPPPPTPPPPTPPTPPRPDCCRPAASRPRA